MTEIILPLVTSKKYTYLTDNELDTYAKMEVQDLIKLKEKAFASSIQSNMGVSDIIENKPFTILPYTVSLVKRGGKLFDLGIKELRENDVVYSLTPFTLPPNLATSNTLSILYSEDYSKYEEISDLVAYRHLNVRDGSHRCRHQFTNTNCCACGAWY